MKFRTWALFVLSGCAILFCVWSGYIFVRTWRMDLADNAPCVNLHGLVIESGNREYEACVNTRAQSFLRVDYAESKDASKAFLTLITAILVASITFSEKIVDVAQSGWTVKTIMIVSWVLFLIAIGSCGAALALMMNAAGYATYFPYRDFRLIEHQASTLFIFSGLSFGTGLAMLMIAGTVSMATRGGRR